MDCSYPKSKSACGACARNVVLNFVKSRNCLMESFHGGSDCSHWHWVSLFLGRQSVICQDLVLGLGKGLVRGHDVDTQKSKSNRSVGPWTGCFWGTSCGPPRFPSAKHSSFALGHIPNTPHKVMGLLFWGQGQWGQCFITFCRTYCSLTGIWMAKFTTGAWSMNWLAAIRGHALPGLSLPVSLYWSWPPSLMTLFDPLELITVSIAFRIEPGNM